MRRKAEDMIVWAAVVIGGGYLVYRLFNQPATPGMTPATGMSLPPPRTPAWSENPVQQSLDTALTNLATGVTGIIG